VMINRKSSDSSCARNFSWQPTGPSAAVQISASRYDWYISAVISVSFKLVVTIGLVANGVEYSMRTRDSPAFIVAKPAVSRLNNGDIANSTLSSNLTSFLNTTV